MKLHTGDLSPYSSKVRMQIYAKGITDIKFDLDPSFRQGKFSTISPIGRIPVLDLGDGDIIPESEIICEYLEEVYPEPSMLGVGPRARAEVRTISRIADIYLMNNIFMALPQLIDPRRIHIIADRGEMPGQGHGQRQTYVAKANNGDRRGGFAPRH